MDDSIRAMFPDDDSALGPFLGNLPPEILDAVVQKLGWFQTTFALAGRTCREAVERVPSTRAVVTEEERGRLQYWADLTNEQRRRLQSREITSLAVAVMEGDVEALEWLIQLFDGRGLEWRDVSMGLSALAAMRGKLVSLKCLRANWCLWYSDTCQWAADGGHLEVLQWAHQNGCPWSHRRALPRRDRATWRFSSGRVRTSARGTRTRACGRRSSATWRCCSGRIGTGARGAMRRAMPRRRKGTWRCCSGRVRTGARGAMRRARARRSLASWRCCSGRVGTGARGASRRAMPRRGRAPGGAQVGASERLRLERVGVLTGGAGRPPGGVAVGASERVPVEP